MADLKRVYDSPNSPSHMSMTGAQPGKVSRCLWAEPIWWQYIHNKKVRSILSSLEQQNREGVHSSCLRPQQVVQQTCSKRTQVRNSRDSFQAFQVQSNKHCCRYTSSICMVT